MKIRPTFFLNGNKSYPVRAGGTLFYRYDDHDNTYSLLLIFSRNIYEDFGGCSDTTDKSIEDMVSREVEEESNCIFRKEYVLNLIKKINQPVYIKQSKYVLYFVQIDELYDPSIFGDREIHDGFSRTVEWINYNDYKNYNDIKKNPRLCNSEVISHMENLFI